MAVVRQREPTAYRSLLLMVAGAVLADPKAMLARLVCGCIALAFTASVPADQSSQGHAHTVKGRRAQLHGTGVATRANCILIVADGGRGGLGRPCADASSPGMRLHRPSLYCLRTHHTLEPWCMSHDPTQISVRLALQELKLRAAHIHCFQQCAIPTLYGHRKHCNGFWLHTTTKLQKYRNIPLPSPFC